MKIETIFTIIVIVLLATTAILIHSVPGTNRTFFWLVLLPFALLRLYKAILLCKIIRDKRKNEFNANLKKQDRLN